MTLVSGMIGRIVEIANDGRHLACERGFLVVRARNEEIGRIPLDDITALIANAHGLSYSNNLLVALAERGCPFVLCGPQHRPVGLLLPLVGHHLQAARMDAQLDAPLPLKKQIWREVVRRKLAMQGAVLQCLGRPSAPLFALLRKVRSGDPSNVEAQGARAYWKLLFPSGFRRDADAPGINGLLNFGYAVLRGLVARHVVAAGLHPGIPVHHASAANPMRLVDDLMEPFRPLVDLLVWNLHQRGTVDVDASARGVLGTLHTRTIALPPRSPLIVIVQRYVTSVAMAFEAKSPDELLPLVTRGEQLASFWDDQATEAEAPRAAETGAPAPA
jgi:CRISPR-associated protein Cas1